MEIATSRRENPTVMIRSLTASSKPTRSHQFVFILLAETGFEIVKNPVSVKQRIDQRYIRVEGLLDRVFDDTRHTPVPGGIVSRMDDLDKRTRTMNKIIRDIGCN